MKNLFHKLTLILLLAIVGCTASSNKDVISEPDPAMLPKNFEGYEKLFNGHNLDGWYVITDGKGEDKNLFAAENEMIHAYPTQADTSQQSFGGIITNKTYSNYVLTLEYKWGNKKFKPRNEFVRDAGVLLHMHGPDIIWPNGVECQIQEGDTGDMWVIGAQASSTVNDEILNYSPEGKLVTRGDTANRFHRFHRSYFWETPGWNTLEIEVKGDHATFSVNGKLVNEAIGMKFWDSTTQLWQPLTTGKILLQAEGAEIYYRNIYIKDL